mgnify:CR=1 FL=1
MTTETKPISQMMKEGCADLHEQAEHATIPARMVSGQMSKDEYVAMLQQGVLWNRALDVAILEIRPSSPYLEALVDDAQLQGPYYDADLKFYGSKAATEPTPGVAALCQALLPTPNPAQPMAAPRLEKVSLQHIPMGAMASAALREVSRVRDLIWYV